MASSSNLETPPETLKGTPLRALHQALGAKCGPFAGWELPLYYTSILDEHQVVRTKAGFFDVSHLGHLEVSGEGCLAPFQLLVTQDLGALEDGAACYTPMLTPRGWILDEMIIYRLAREQFRLVVNAANGDKVLAWLRSRLPNGLRIEDLRESIGTLALQGPRAAEIFSRVSSLQLKNIPRYHLVQTQVLDRPVGVARTGYTGEDGCELFVPSGDLPKVWQGLLEMGRPLGLQPVGLGARDTLRLEAGLPLGGSDLDEKSTPLEAGLEWTVEWRKGPFVGREALERQKREGPARQLVGFEMKEPGVPRHGYPIFQADEKIGQVTSGTMVPTGYNMVPGTKQGEPVPGTGFRGIGMGYVPPAASRPGTKFLIEIHQRKFQAEVVKLPFYRRAKS